MLDTLYPSSIGGLSAGHKRLASEPHDAFQIFSRMVFADGRPDEQNKASVDYL